MAHRIEEWEQSGLMTPDQVSQRLDEDIIEYITFGEPELAALRDNFNLVCCVGVDGTNYWDEATFVDFLARSVPSPTPHLIEAGPIIFASALYLGNYPFKSDTSSFLTYEKLLRFLFWVLPDRAARLIAGGLTSRNGKDTIIVRARTPADQRRLLFQSLAESSDESLSFDTEEEEKIATQKANEVAKHQIGYAATNYDSDGDEIYHDILDVLSETQPVGKGITHVIRDDLRPLAKRLHDPQPLLRQRIIQQERFKSLVKVLFTLDLSGYSSSLPNISEIDNAADLVVKTFSQESVGGITWKNFDSALTRPRIFSPLYSLLSTLLKIPSSCSSKAPLLSRPGSILTPLILSQIKFILSDIVSSDYIHLKFHSIPSALAVIDANAVPETIQAIKNPSDFSLLVISGKSSSTGGEPVIFGAFLPSPIQAENELLEEEPNWEHALLFQLAPVTDVFQSRVGKRAWIQNGETVCFGDKGSGFAMEFTEGLKQLNVSHSVEGKDSTYQATEWRENWDLDIEVDQVEVWASSDN